jgi:cytochrome c-type biogenesis protein CcmF
MVVLMIAMVIGPALKWKRDSLRNAIFTLRTAIAIAVAGAVLVAALTLGKHLLTAMGIGLSLWIICGSLMAVVNRMKLGRTDFSQSLKLAANAPRSFYGLVMAHMGFGFVVGAITTVSTWQLENVTAMKQGESAGIAGYAFLLRDVKTLRGAQYDADMGTFDVTLDGSAITTLTAERRFYHVQQQQTTHTGIRTNFISNIYVTLGEPDAAGRWVVRLYYHPLAPWLWLGGMTMALGGFISLSDRRFRVGAPQRAHATLNPAPAE